MAIKTPHVSARVQAAIEAFIAQLRRRQIYGSHAVSEKLLDVLRMVVSSGKWRDVESLLDLIKLVGKRCQDAQPIELCIGNTVRRLLNVIREECLALQQQKQQDRAGEGSNEAGRGSGHDNADAGSQSMRTGATPSPSGSLGAPRFVDPSPSMLSLFAEPDAAAAVDYGALRSQETKPLFVEALNEILDEMRSMHDTIAAQSLANVHSNEIVLTQGYSKTVAAFFKYVAKKRPFQVIVAEGGPGFGGHKLAAELAAADIETTLIPDACVFAVMSRVNKVVLGTHAVLANGGLVALAGSSTVAASAKHYNIPTVVLAGLHKLTPRHPADLDELNVLTSPANIVAYADDELAGQAHIIAPYFDYVAPEFVTLLITNDGAYSPSYMYRLLTESYHPDDVDLQPRPGAFDKYLAKKPALSKAHKAGKGKASPAAVSPASALDGDDDDMDD